MRIERVAPTPFLVGPEGALRQVLRVVLVNPGAPSDARLEVFAGERVETDLGAVPAGESVHEVIVPAPGRPVEARFSLQVGGEELHRTALLLQPPKRLRVHLVQRSHHDVGYTNLPSAVLREHEGFLDRAIDMAEATAGFPEEAQLRIVVEQAWSVERFLRHAPAERVERFLALVRSGHVEVTALFGNLTTELCGSEALVRALAHARRVSRRSGVPLVTAEHNDVPGMSWGLAEVLAAAGIRLFCPTLPRYWSWSKPALPSFWDDAALFPNGQPGAFWWEAPSGKRLLLWDNYGAGGDCRPALLDLGDRLQALAEKGYPYEAIRWPVTGGARDNAPYIDGFCATARDWNARWTYPRLIVSTNARFHAEIAGELPEDLPVFRGELPGPDYPVGAASTAEGTAENRRNHARLLTAERLATFAAATTDYSYQEGGLFDAYEDVLWYDEHTWGHHFPAGPSSRTSELEKGVHAHRAAALAYDVRCKALARIADHVRLPEDGLHLVVFNPLPTPRTAPVSTPMREIDNCGSTMAEVTDAGGTYFRGVLLGDRWHTNPPPELATGDFDLVEVESGEVVPFQMVEVRGADDTVPFAPQRFGLGQGGRRYGFMEPPGGLARDLRFLARDVPACGYRTYHLQPRPGAAAESASRVHRGAVLENEFYRVALDPEGTRIASILDKELGRELLDPEAPHRFGDLVVRDPFSDALRVPEDASWAPGIEGPVCATLECTASVHGHPRIRQTLTLHHGVKRIDFAVRVLKDPTPLLDAHLAFPFRVEQPRFRYEGCLSLLSPVEDYLPGAYWDTVAVQNWVRVSGVCGTLLWSSLDAPLAGLGSLWPGYVSPAHSARVPERAHHPPTPLEAVRNGWIYSTLFTNNFATNFAVSQAGSVLFRYVLTSRPGEVSDAAAARFGREATLPLETIFTERRREGHLPLSRSFLEVRGDVALLACKRADDGKGWILRFWNPGSEAARAQVETAFAEKIRASLAGPDEGDPPVADPTAELVSQHARGFELSLGPRALATVRVVPGGGK